MSSAIASTSAPSSLRKKSSLLSLRSNRKDAKLPARPATATTPRPSNGFNNPSERTRSKPSDSARSDGRFDFPLIDLPLLQDPPPRRSSRPREAREYLPPLRTSAGSSSAFSPSPPPTPTSLYDGNASAPPLFEVMSAPVLEATAMDAFVSDMNGGVDDVFSDIEAMRGERSKKRTTSTSAKSTSHHPPLPTPPPGVKLGKSTTARSRAHTQEGSAPESKRSTDENRRPRPSIQSDRSFAKNSNSRPAASRGGSTGTITSSTPVSSAPPTQLPSPSLSPTLQRGNAKYSAPPASLAISSSDVMHTDSSIDDIIRKFVTVTNERPKEIVPSISEIIRTHAPQHARNRHQQKLSVTTGLRSLPNGPSQDDPSDMVSRSSMDSVAEEAQNSLIASHKQHQECIIDAMPNDFTASFSGSQSNPESPSIVRTPHSEVRSAPTDYSFSTSGEAAFLEEAFVPYTKGKTSSPNGKAALATLLRSPRLTGLMTLTKPPNAKLQVSYSDLGSPTGRPVLVFLGLGCVRYIMGLYDEMAEALGLRLIAIDRWGLGRTSDVPKNTERGVRDWASVVEEVLDRLDIQRCSVMAHSAGAPYAMAFATWAPDRVLGDLCLLAPWVAGSGENSGYKWLKYVPSGIIKTAQAAEWRMQTWMIGKPPTLSHTGIGFDLNAPVSSSAVTKSSRPGPSLAASLRARDGPLAARPSQDTTFSEYDDLADFDGNYGSHSTVHLPPDSQSSSPEATMTRRRAGSKAGRFLGGLLRAADSPPRSPKVKGKKSTTSLRSSPKLGFTSSALSSARPETSRVSSSSVLPDNGRCHTRSRRSISLTSLSPSAMNARNIAAERRLSSPPPTPAPDNASLGNALLAASHAESSRGTHADLLRILNHGQKPFGFSYHDFCKPVRVWYGEKDEKISEGAVRWMEKTMPPDTCRINIVPGAGHGLMYHGAVVVEALETLQAAWADSD